MKICPACNSVMDDNVLFCTVCGSKFSETNDGGFANTNDSGAYSSNSTSYNNSFGNTQYDNAGGVFTADTSDHTAEFDVEDVASNKLFAMLIYIGSVVGLIVAILMKKDSPYLDFHIRQGVKIYITELLFILPCALLSWLVIPAIIAMIVAVILLVIRVICFVQVAQGKSKEPEIIKTIDFLK